MKILNYFNTRKKILRYTSLFGVNFAEFLIRSGYQIRNSIFFRENLSNVETSKKDLFDTVSQKYIENQKITYLEFGVYRGSSFNYWLNLNLNEGSQFFGFDTFTGLPEDWGHIPKGHFDTGGNIPSYDDDRYQFFEGLFQKTLPEFMKSHQTSLKGKTIYNLDADLYSSTLYVLITMVPFLKSGDILIFDEFFSITNASTEFRAYLDFLEVYDIKLQVISKSYYNCAMIVEKVQEDIFNPSNE